MGGRATKAILSQAVVRVHATNARPILDTARIMREPSKDTTTPFGSVMPCALWIVSAHASFSGTPIRMSDRFLVDFCWMQGTGTQLTGKPGSFVTRKMQDHHVR